jgi:hypothetical protein
MCIMHWCCIDASTLMKREAYPTLVFQIFNTEFPAVCHAKPEYLWTYFRYILAILPYMHVHLVTPQPPSHTHHPHFSNDLPQRWYYNNRSLTNCMQVLKLLCQIFFVAIFSVASTFVTVFDVTLSVRVTSKTLYSPEYITSKHTQKYRVYTCPASVLIK